MFGPPSRLVLKLDNPDDLFGITNYKVRMPAQIFCETHLWLYVNLAVRTLKLFSQLNEKIGL